MVNINWALIAPILIIQVILLLVAIVDLVKVKETNGPKWLWALIIVLISIIGPVLYFIFGRRSR
ncbi:PLD nuclease N-terminal domain-containing protein [Paucisalibacillus globulus]|uniref:PLD nuclease N-terminal domain-containing protein n=1 Tax=Paucisalibacillus globulus TaxID=351095 RepID=UPI0003F9597E|nr:PLD nuclease N-terminal domain-containing protein [Paucisalibacillus globulus]